MVTSTLILFALAAAGALLALASDNASPGVLILAVVSVGMVAYLCWFMLEVARKQLARGAVLLTPSGVHHKSWSFDSFLAWEQALSVSPGHLDGHLITVTTYHNAQPRFGQRSAIWKQPEAKLAPHIAIRGSYLAIDPALALHTLTFYCTNPRARAELGKDAAVQRVRSGNVGTG